MVPIEKVMEAMRNVPGNGVVFNATLCWVDSRKLNGESRVDLRESIHKLVDPDDIYGAA